MLKSLPILFSQLLSKKFIVCPQQYLFTCQLTVSFVSFLSLLHGSMQEDQSYAKHDSGRAQVPGLKLGKPPLYITLWSSGVGKASTPVDFEHKSCTTIVHIEWVDQKQTLVIEINGHVNMMMLKLISSFSWDMEGRCINIQYEWYLF